MRAGELTQGAQAAALDQFATLDGRVTSRSICPPATAIADSPVELNATIFHLAHIVGETGFFSTSANAT